MSRISHRFLVAFLASATVFGQGNTGGIVGTITDPSSAVVTGAKVIVTNTRTGVKTEGSTDTQGGYVFNFLSPGTYQLETEVAGFKKFVRAGIALETGRQLRLDVALETGAVTETVNVDASAPLLETETGTLSGTIENRQVISLPTLGRNPQDYRLLVPGV